MTDSALSLSGAHLQWPRNVRSSSGRDVVGRRYARAASGQSRYACCV